MDVAALTMFLAPFLAAFLKPVRAALESGAERGGAAAVEHAQGLWDRLRGKVGESADAEDAALKVADRPSSPRRRRALAQQIERILAEDPELAREIGLLWANAEAAGVVAVASGDRSAAVAGNVSGSVIVTGDDVSVER